MDEMDSYDDSPKTSGDWDIWSNSPKRKLTEKETFKKLDELDIEYVENYLREKKLKKIRKDLAD